MDVIAGNISQGGEVRIRITPEDIVPSGNPQFGILRDAPRNFLSATWSRRELGLFVEIAEGVSAFCIPRCFLESLNGADSTVVFTNASIRDSSVNKLLGIYCSPYFERLYFDLLTGTEKDWPIAIAEKAELRIFGDGKANRITADLITLRDAEVPEFLRVEVTGKLRGSDALEPVLDGPKFIEAVTGVGTLALGPNIPVPNVVPDLAGEAPQIEIEWIAQEQLPRANVSQVQRPNRHQRRSR